MLTLSGTTSPQNYASAIQSVTFSTTSSSGIADRVVSLVVNDGTYYSPAIEQIVGIASTSQTLNLGTTTGNVQVAIYNSDFEVTIGGLPTLEYSQANYNYVEFGSSSTPYSVTINDDTTTGGFNGGISQGRTTIAAPHVTVLATNFFHETFNGNPNSPTSDAIAFNGSGAGETFTATLEPGGTALDATMRDSQNTVYSNAANDCLVQQGAYVAGPSSANFIDESGDATINFGVSAGLTTVTSSASPNLLLKIINFTTITASVASSVENNGDVANLYDTSGNDTFTATGGSATASNSATLAPADGSSYSYTVNGFYQVNAYSVNGGTDNAVLTDSTGADAFTGTPTYSSIGNGGIYQDTAYGFSSVQAVSAGGGHGTATFEASGTLGTDFSYNSSTHTLESLATGATTTASGFASYSTDFATPPAITIPGTQDIAQNAPLTFSSAGNNAISVTDSETASEQLTLTPADGTLALGSTTATVSGAGSAGSPFVVTGTLSQINAALAGMVFTPTTDFNDGAASIGVSVEDLGDGLTAPPATVEINVAVDQPPVLTRSTSTDSFTAGGSPVAVDPLITVADPDNAMLASATVTISAGHVSSEDQLGYASVTGITASLAGNVLTFTGPASPAAFQSELESLTYADTNSVDPNTSPRTISITVSDGQLNGAAVAYTIDVIPAITSPVISVPETQSTTQGLAMDFSWANANAITVTDPQIGSGTDSMTLSVGDGTLTLGSTAGLASSAGNGGASITMSGTLATLDAALDGLEYTPDADFTGNDTLSLAITDSAAPGAPLTGNGSVSIGVTAAQQPPVLTQSAESLYYSPGSGAVTIDPGLALSDGESGTIQSATISFSSGYVSGEDSLVFANQNGISGSFVSSAGTLTLSGSASVADYQAALASVQYEDSQQNPTSGQRTISFVVDDGQLSSEAIAYSINVVPASSSLAISALGSQSVAENGSLGFSWAGQDPISVADPSIAGGTDSMTLSVNNGTLYLGTSAGLATSAGNGSASISMSGTLAALDAALDGLWYFPNSDYTGADTLSLSITDSTLPAGQQTTSTNVPITVSPQAPSPSFSLGPAQQVPSGVGPQTISGWATGISSGLTDGTDATLSFIVSVPADEQGWFSALPAIDANGDLTYTPALGASGVATISVELEATPTDGAPVTSAASTFTIAIGTNADGSAIEPELFAPSSELLPWGTPVTLGSSSQGGIYVGGDTDANAQVTVTISTTVGWLNMANGSNAVLTNDNSSQVTVSGDVADVDADLASLNLNPDYPLPNYTSGGTLTVSLQSSSTGSGAGVVSVTNTISMTFLDISSTQSSGDISITLPSGQAVPENQWLTFSSATGNPITINANPSAEAEVTITDGDPTNNAGNDSDEFALATTSGLTMLTGSGYGDLTETFTGTVADINAALDGLEFSAPYQEAPSLIVLATLLDSSGAPTAEVAAATSDITVRSAPTFNAYADLWLDDEPEYSDDFYSATADDPVFGTFIQDFLFPAALQPTDGGSYGIGSCDTGDGLAPGIAITGLDTSEGYWQVSATGGGNPADWQRIGAVSDTYALLLDASDEIRFVPTAGYFGDITDAITVYSPLSSSPLPTNTFEAPPQSSDPDDPGEHEVTVDADAGPLSLIIIPTFPVSGVGGPPANELGYTALNPPPGENVWVSSYTQPLYGTVSMGTDGSFTYTGMDGDLMGQVDQFSYTITDGAVSFTSLMDIQAGGTGDPSEITGTPPTPVGPPTPNDPGNESYTVLPGDTLSVGLDSLLPALMGSADRDAGLSVVQDGAITQVSGTPTDDDGSVVINTNGTLSFTAPPTPGVYEVPFVEENSAGDEGDVQLAMFTVPQVTATVDSVLFSDMTPLGSITSTSLTPDVGPPGVSNLWSSILGSTPIVLPSVDALFVNPLFSLTLPSGVAVPNNISFRATELDGAGNMTFSGTLQQTVLGSGTTYVNGETTYGISTLALQGGLSAQNDHDIGTSQLTLYWEVSLDGHTWVSAGVTTNTLYVTWWQDPLDNATSPTYLTSIATASNALTGLGFTSATPEADIVNAVFAAFATLNVTRTSDGQTLTYWNDWYSMNYTTSQLLSSGDGKCGAWASFYCNALASEGITANIVTVTPPTPPLLPGITSLDGFLLVKSWTFGTSSPTISVGGVTYNHLLQGWTVASPASGAPNFANVFAGPIVDGTFGGSIPVQGRTRFPQTVFTNHALVTVPGSSGLYYDPSYGGTYSSLIDFQDTALAGVGVGNLGSSLIVHAIGPGAQVELGEESDKYNGG